MTSVKQFVSKVNPQEDLSTPQAGECNTRPDSQSLLSPRLDYLTITFTAQDLQALRAILRDFANLIAPPPRDNWPAPLRGHRLSYAQQKKAYHSHRLQFQKLLTEHADLQDRAFDLLDGQPYKVCDAHYFPNRIESAYPINGGYKPLPDGRFSVFLRLSGKFFDALDLPAQKDFLLICDGLADYKISRIDVALDDFSMQVIPYDKILESCTDGNYAGFKKSSMVKVLSGGKHREETLYLGSRESRSFWRIYWKSDRLRLEREIKGAEADSTFQELVRLAKISHSGSFLEWVKSLARLSIAGLDFVSRAKEKKREKNLNRCKRLAWWDAFVSLIGEGLRLVVPRIPPSPEKVFGWLERQVLGTMSALSQGLGISQFNQWFYSRLQGKKLTRQNERLIALIQASTLSKSGPILDIA